MDWFNSPYYHLLYNNRNDSEASFFIDQLCGSLRLPKNACIWDLACGKGRHAIALNQKGFNVTGTDLSVNSIREASAYSSPSLQFFVHDMRAPFKIGYFDAVFNLFTSIGYFKEYNDNFSVFENVSLSLKKNGLFVVDFFNSAKVISSFVSGYHEDRGHIQFDITKKIINNAIVKRIEFSDEGRNYYFEEYVSLFTRKDFETFAQKADLRIENTFGSYALEPFDERTSERLILIFKK